MIIRDLEFVDSLVREGQVESSSVSGGVSASLSLATGANDSYVYADAAAEASGNYNASYAGTATYYNGDYKVGYGAAHGLAYGADGGDYSAVQGSSTATNL